MKALLNGSTITTFRRNESHMGVMYRFKYNETLEYYIYVSLQDRYMIPSNSGLLSIFQRPPKIL